MYEVGTEGSERVTLLDTSETTVGNCGMRSSGWQVDYWSRWFKNIDEFRSATRLYSKRPRKTEELLTAYKQYITIT